jgi:hypothetical protein
MAHVPGRLGRLPTIRGPESGECRLKLCIHWDQQLPVASTFIQWSSMIQFYAILNFELYKLYSIFSRENRCKRPVFLGPFRMSGQRHQTRTARPTGTEDCRGIFSAPKTVDGCPSICQNELKLSPNLDIRTSACWSVRWIEELSTKTMKMGWYLPSGGVCWGTSLSQNSQNCHLRPSVGKFRWLWGDEPGKVPGGVTDYGWES